MKNKLLPLLSLLLFPFFAQADSGKFFADIKYIYDTDSEFNDFSYGAKFGYTFKAGGSVDLEVNILEYSASGEDPLGNFSNKLRVIPIMLNYTNTIYLGGIQSKETDRGTSIVDFFVYYGAGVGASVIEFDAELVGVDEISDNSTVFSAQFFLGLDLSLSENVSSTVGYRYLWTDGPRLFSTEFEDDGFSLLEASIRFSF